MKKEFKGTKGEWEWSVSEVSNGFAYVNGGDITIFGDKTETQGTISQETEANAKLISKAPEMLAILIKLIDKYEFEIGENLELNDLINEILD